MTKKQYREVLEAGCGLEKSCGYDTDGDCAHGYEWECDNCPIVIEQNEKADKQRLKQMEINCQWLIDITDRIHDALCPDQCGTWQERAKQAVEAAERLASNKDTE